jgi:hypothetical protein
MFDIFEFIQSPEEPAHGRFTRNMSDLNFFEQESVSTLACEIFYARYRSCIGLRTVSSKSALSHAYSGSARSARYIENNASCHPPEDRGKFERLSAAL